MELVDLLRVILHKYISGAPTFILITSNIITKTGQPPCWQDLILLFTSILNENSTFNECHAGPITRTTEGERVCTAREIGN